MADLAECVDELPNICGSEERIRQAIRASRTDPVFLPQGAKGFGEITSAFSIALHMHQPLIPAGGPELRTAQMISNLQWMLDNPDIDDNHNARVFLWCYRRMGEFVPQLLDEGFQPARPEDLAANGSTFAAAPKKTDQIELSVEGERWTSM